MMDEIDMEVAPVSPEVDTQQVLQQWREKHEQGVLSTSNFNEYWRIWVPRNYSPSMSESCLNWNFDEEKASRTLIAPLEEFICGGDPVTVLDSLSQGNKPPSVCGRVFKLGEPTYMCRECGMDNTCVLCVDCFKKSEHRHHKYKMGTSGGGGCCDCGDREAWRRAPFCDIHLAGVEVQDNVSQILPEDLIERTRTVFEAVLWYAYNLLTQEQSSNLRLRDPEDNLFDMDTYCTVLYNDEVHTFEQVIATINRVIKCSQRNSIEYVTNIDREGRAVVKCSKYQHCNEMKAEIEKFTSRHGGKALKVLVVHSHEVAHQIFAMKVLAWLQRFLGHGEGFRRVFAEVALKPKQADPSIVIGILLRDSQLWKSARSHWHHLFISGMLLEYENKKALAKVFTKYYGNVMKDFIKDDHDHSFSISSLSVQLFTVPTIAHHLIANDDALFILLNTFISECWRKCNADGKLEFDRNNSSQAFKRAQYIMYDLRYLLSAIPETWTDELRRSFLHGLSILLNLLTMMQEMDSVTRQVGQHMEFEPEWESAFNLHIKLAYCISLAIEWCGTDKVVLIKAYRATLRKLYEQPCYDPNDTGEVRELLDYSVMCLHYDVSAKPVSIHLPLSRFLAGLHLHMKNFGLSYDGPEFQTPKPTPMQIIEPVLRTQVMIAQVHAGMWRRNGYALLNQLYFYHNVKCRTEMLDRDITLLQIGASLIESNEFLIHLLNKFNLLNWADTIFEEKVKSREEDIMRQTINLVEEFLQLLCVIIGERYVPGISDITTEDRIKKEIVQHLCIKPLPHSELNKTIPDDLTNDTGLDDVIEKLADFKKPPSYGKGVFELKPEFFKDYNVFYYHYTKEELSKSEEEQRKRRKTEGELECCPPPLLPVLNPAFNMIMNLLQCDVMLHIMQTVLLRSINLKALSFSELQLHKVLHLIGYALQEEQSKAYPFLLFSEKATRWFIPNYLEELYTSPRIEAHKGLIKWTLNKFKEVMKVEGCESEESTCSMEVEKPAVPDEKEKGIRSKKAAERRAKLMAQMAAMQKVFINENAELFEETVTGTSKDSREIERTIDKTVVQEPVALGPLQTERRNVEQTYVCILCQEDQKVTTMGPSLVLCAYIHQATVLCQHRNSETLMDVANHDPLYLNANLGPAPHTSTCGHVMHSECWQEYFNNVMLKEHRRPYRLRHPASFDVDKQEFLCPLCECLSNTVLPIVPSLCSMQPSHPKNDIDFDDWLQCIITTVNKKTCKEASKCNIVIDSSECKCNTLPVYQCKSAESLLTELGEHSQKFLDLFPTGHIELSPNLVNVIQKYTQIAYTRGLQVNPHPTDRRLCPMAWKSCSYTVHAIESMLRDEEKSLLGCLSSRQRDCLQNLVRVMGVLGTRRVVNSSYALRLLSILLEHAKDGPSILAWDSFGFLVSLTFTLPDLFGKSEATPIPTGGTLEWHTLRIIFIAHIVKILVGIDLEEVDSGMDVSDSDCDQIFDVLKLMNKSKDDLSGHAIWKHVQWASLPFLRCCVLLYRFLTDVPAPSSLLEVSGDTFDSMCAYLDLPTTPKELFSSELVMQLVEKWCQHEAVVDCLGGNTELLVKEPVQINHLVELPNDYSELINTVSSFTCPNSDREDSRNPTMCLVCGEVLCSQSYCCQTEYNKVIIGACNYHAHKCGSGLGIFLRVRECEIMFLASPHRGCFVSPPYLDDYGETDQGLRRGNPLRLCKERYKKLQNQWLSHSIHEAIARYMEFSSSMVPTQWQHL